MSVFLELGLVPRALNYYYRDNIFHGTAFANFVWPEEAQTALNTITGHVLDGQRLQAEHKILPLARRQLRVVPRDRIIPAQRIQLPPAEEIMELHPWVVDLEASPETVDLDMNNSATWGFYTQMQLFRNSPSTEGKALRFPSTLNSQQRAIIGSLAEKLSLHHTIKLEGTEIYIQVSRCKFLSYNFPQVSIPELNSGRTTLQSVTSLGSISERQQNESTAQAETSTAEAISNILRH